MVYLHIQNKSIKELKEYENNPRKNEKAVDEVVKSIKEFGFRIPILIDKQGVIIAGHTRKIAAEKLGIKEVPTIEVEGLTDEQIEAFRLVDNKTSEYAKWDFDRLDAELKKIQDIDMSQFGFEMPDLELEDEPKAEIEFTKSLDENHNYVVLYFDNSIDWLNAQSIFEIESVKELSTRKDGAIHGKGITGIGRIIDGAKALEKLTGGEL